MAVFLWASSGFAGELATCATSVRGVAQDYFYDADSPVLKESRSMLEWGLGRRGKITCPGLVTLRVLTPELSDADRAPFCLQWNRTARTYIGYAEGARDAWMTCKRPSRTFCQRVNGSKDAAKRLTGKAAEFAVTAGVKALVQPSGAVVMKGPAAAIGGKLVELGAGALGGVSAPVALGAVAITAVAVGGAVYVCSESGAEGAALDPAPVQDVAAGAAISGVPVK